MNFSIFLFQVINTSSSVFPGTGEVWLLVFSMKSLETLKSSLYLHLFLLAVDNFQISEEAHLMNRHWKMLQKTRGTLLNNLNVSLFQFVRTGLLEESVGRWHAPICNTCGLPLALLFLKSSVFDVLVVVAAYFEKSLNLSYRSCLQSKVFVVRVLKLCKPCFLSFFFQICSRGVEVKLVKS